MMPLLPLDADALDVALTHFQKVSLIASSLVGFLFMARAILTALDFGTVEDFGELVKDVFLYFLVITLFPELFKITTEVISGLSYRLYWEPASVATESSFLWKVVEHNSYYNLIAKLAPSAVVHLAETFSTIVISVLVAIGPIVILLNTLLDFNKGLMLYLTMLLSFCLWPVLWNLLGILGNELWGAYMGTELQRLIFWFTIMLVQFISPWICIYLFNSMEPDSALKKAAGTSLGHTLKLPF